MFFFFFSSRRRHTRWNCDWSSDVCSSDLENGLRLVQTLAFHATDEPVGVDINVVEGKRGGVAQAYAVLVFRFVVGESLRVFFHHEPAWARGRAGQYRVGAGASAVADLLLVTVDLVADDRSEEHTSELQSQF